jgi:hypothetical protein
LQCHTSIGRAVRTLLGVSRTMQLAGRAVVAVEITAAPLAFLFPSLRRGAILAAWCVHVGIALCMRNTALLSFAACTAWVPFWDVEVDPVPAAGGRWSSPRVAFVRFRPREAHQAPGAADPQADSPPRLSPELRSSPVLRLHTPVPVRPSPPLASPLAPPTSALRLTRVDATAACGLVWRHAADILLVLFALATAHHQWSGGAGPSCGGHASPDAVRRMLLHNRWNVFTSAESHVMWEVAPARISDGSVVDLWRDQAEISWAVPTGEEPARRRGRWRAFPYLAERGEEEQAAFWGALCDEWSAHDVEGRGVEQFRFYLMTAEAIPVEEELAALRRQVAAEAEAKAEGLGRSYGAVRKRLVVSFSCKERAVL